MSRRTCRCSDFRYEILEYVDIQLNLAPKSQVEEYFIDSRRIWNSDFDIIHDSDDHELPQLICAIIRALYAKANAKITQSSNQPTYSTYYPDQTNPI